MKSRHAPRSFSIGRVLIIMGILLLCLISLLSHSLLKRGPFVETPSSRSVSFELSDLAADVRTVIAAISYLLDPESSEPVQNAA